MPTWAVSEPYINLWLYDEPVGYQPGIGPRMSFKLAYKQRATNDISPQICNVGTNWNCAWLNYVADDGVGAQATLVSGRGGRAQFVPDGASVEYYTHSTLERQTTGGSLSGFVRTFPNGAKDYYQTIPANGVVLPDGSVPAFLSSRVDRSGRTFQQYVYEEQLVSGSYIFRLKQVLDGDGRTNTLAYTNTALPTRITGVTDPFGRQAFLKYDSQGTLTNLIDAVGMSSSVKYDEHSWITNLATPYGQTSFQHVDNGFDPSIYLIRGIRVVDPAGGTNIYMLRQVTDFDRDQLFAPYVADAMLDNAYFQYRNSLHWGPRTAGSLPLDWSTLSLSDFINARMRHWLHYGNDCGGDAGIGQSLSFEIEPSPDGVHYGQVTWYDYAGKNCRWFEGTNSLPSLVVRSLPDGTLWYTAYQRDVWGRPTNVVDTYSASFGATPNTRSRQYVYDGSSPDLLKVIGPMGETLVGYAYTNHLVRYATNAVGDVTSYAYDAQSRLTSAKSPAGLTRTNVYFTSGSDTNFVQSTIDLEIGRTNSFTYANDLVYTVKDERGMTTTNLYDALNRLTNSANALGSVSYIYNRLDLVRVVDRLGFTTSYAYDAERRRVAETNALGNTTFYNYCVCGALDSIQDADGNYTSFYYDNAGRRIQTSYPDGYSVVYNYNLLGELTNTVDSAGYSLTNWFNNQGLLYSAQDAGGAVSFRAYDIEDRATNSWDVNGVSTVMTYDNAGRLLTRAFPDGGIEHYGYSPSGLVAYTNQIGSFTHYVYDAAGRKTAETNANNEFTLFGYSPAGDLLTLTDGKNQTTTWGYDQFGRVTNKLDQLNATIFSYTYDADNRLLSRWTPAKGSTAYSYDPVGNLTNVAYPTSGTVQFAFDPMNRMIDMVDSLGATHYTYDAAGQKLTEGGLFASDTVSNTYSNRRRIALGLAQSAGVWTNGFDWDAAGRLADVVSPAGTFYYAYTALDPAFSGRLRQSLSLPNGAAITNAYDPVARLLDTVLESSGGSALDAARYGYNAASERTAYTNAAGAYVLYGYDPIAQLKTAQSSVAGENRGYTYDHAWNLNYRTNNGSLQTFGVNSLNELTTAPAGSYAYDANGNLTNGAGIVYVYDDENRLVQASQGAPTSGAWASTFAYDGLGRLRLRTEYLGNGTGWDPQSATEYIYDGMRVVQERDGSNTPTVSYTRGPDLSGSFEGAGGIGGLLARSTDQYATNTSLTVTITNEFNVSFTYWIYDATDTLVDQVDVAGGTAQSFTFDATAGEGYTISGLDDLYHEVSVEDDFTATLDHHGSDFRGEGDVVSSDSGDPLGLVCNWPRHDCYFADGNGNITSLVDASQSVVASYRYDAFGNTLSQSGTLADANVYRFSSKALHANSGLYYYGYRFYDPSLQRWLNRDPKGEESDRNLYRSLRNSAINVIDPFGDKCDGYLCLCSLVLGKKPVKPLGCTIKCYCWSPFTGETTTVTVDGGFFYCTLWNSTPGGPVKPLPVPIL